MVYFKYTVQRMLIPTFVLECVTGYFLPRRFGKGLGTFLPGTVPMIIRSVRGW